MAIPPPAPAPPNAKNRARDVLDAAIASVGRLWAGSPEWYQAAAFAMAVLFINMVILFALLTLAGVTQEAPTAWGALFVAGTTLATFFVGRLAQELERRDQRNEARTDLAIALYAEIWSNLQQQRRVLTLDSIDRKIESELGMPKVPRAAAVTALSEAKAGATADSSDPIFSEAMKHYERIPHECMLAVVLYYNLNGMLNQSTGAIAEKTLSGLRPDQKAQTLVGYYELANKTDTSAMWALRKLHGFIGSPKNAILPGVGLSPFKFHKRRYRLLTEALERPGKPAPAASHSEMAAETLADMAKLASASKVRERLGGSDPS
ncbi:MAG TPA: hypothetical protein VLA00_17595 [Xanthobacteraceae bacterium]|nr:hypothetical protein [Xanthobacteraceae bacterium]